MHAFTFFVYDMPCWRIVFTYPLDPLAPLFPPPFPLIIMFCCPRDFVEFAERLNVKEIPF